MTGADDVVFLLDVDNTLLDNDLRAHLASEFGSESRDRYWEIFEALRVELGCADYLGALQRHLSRYITELAVTRLTSNPTIFDHATMNGYICDVVLIKARRQVRQALCFKRVSEDLIQTAPACTAISITSVARPQSLLNSGHLDH